ncbi:MAG: hypothetical protein QJR13_03385, partial [Bacillota bacterium]|nr:hypothetical protein [Bacillota bacterium]
MNEWSRKVRAAAGWAAVLALALAWAAGPSGGGAARAAGKPLTLSEALRLGAEASPRLREAQHRLADGEQRLANLERGHLRLSVEVKPRLFGDLAEGGTFWSLDSTLTASYFFRPGGTLSLVADWYPEAEWGAPSSPGSGLAAE